MSRELKAGSAYIDIIARADQLKSQMGVIESDIKKTAAKFEDYFRNLRLDIDNRLMVMKFSDLKALYKSLQIQLQQKIKLDADVASIEKTRIALDSVRSVMGRLNQATVGYNAVGVDFVRIIQDSPFFLQSMQVGVLAVANNFQQLAMSTSMALQRGQTFRQLISSMVTGMNGWMLAIQLAISAILGFALSQRNTKEEISKTNDELKTQEEIMKRMSGITLNDAIMKMEEEVNLLKKKREIEKKNFEQEMIERNARRNLGGTTIIPMFQFSKQEELDRQSKLLMMYQAQLVALGGIENTKNRIKELEDLRAKVIGDANNEEAQALRQNYTWQIEALQQQLNAMEFKKEKQKELKILTDAELESQIAIVKENLKRATSAREEYLWRKMLYDLEKKRAEYLPTEVTPRGLDIRGQFITPLNTSQSVKSQMSEFIEDMDKPAQSIKNSNEQFDKGITLQQQYFNTMASGFSQAIFGANNFLDSLKRIALQLAEMVTTALFFEAIWTIFNPTKLSGGLFSGLFQRTTFQTPTYQTPQMAGISSVNYSFNDSNIVNAIKSLSTRNGNQNTRPIILVMDKKVVGRAFTEQQYFDTYGNIKVR